MSKSTSLTIVSSKNVFLVSGFSGSVENMVNHVAVADDVQQAIVTANNEISDFNLISATSLFQIEQTVLDLRQTLLDSGIGVN